MSSGIIEIIKNVALNAFEASNPVKLLFGKVLSKDPLKVQVGEFLTLTHEFLVTIGEVDEGDFVSILRCQGGQKYVVLGARTAYVQNDSYNGGGTTVDMANGDWQYPFKDGYTKTSDFGWRRLRGSEDYHTGVDIVGSGSKHIYPVNNGKVVWTKSSNSGYGNHLLIDHGGGIWSLYAHMSKIYVQANQSVDKNTILGVEGSTGNSTGSHLHLEIRKSATGSYIDPVPFLNSN